MRSHLLGPFLLVVATGVGAAEEMEGRVNRVTGNEVLVELPAGPTPSPGNGVVLGWILKDIGEFVEARRGTVKEVRGDGVLVALEPGDASVQVGYIARVSIEEVAVAHVEPAEPTASGLPEDPEREMDILITLLRLGMVQEEWKAQDMDRNGLLDYWTRDMASMHYREVPECRTGGAIDGEVARADKVGLGGCAADEPVPFKGYWFSAVRLDAAGRPYAQVADAAGVPSTHPSAWAICAWPANHGGATRHTYIVDERLVVYRKDRGAAAVDRVDAWPKGGPVAGGWTECEGIMVTRPLEGEDHPRK